MTIGNTCSVETHILSYKPGVGRRRVASAKKLGRNFYDPSKPLVVYLEQMFVVATLGFIHIQVGLVQYC